MRDLVTLRPDASCSKPKILDIGCNDGSLLTAKEKGFGLGIEPTGTLRMHL